MREQAPRFGGVVAAEIRSFANLAECIVQRLFALALQKREEAPAPRFEQIRRAIQTLRAFFCRGCLPLRKEFVRDVHRCFGRERRCGDTRRAVLDLVEQPAQRAAMAEFDARRIHPRAIEIARQRNANIVRAAKLDVVGRRAKQGFQRNFGVRGGRRERRVGAIFEQAPHEVGE